LCQLHHWHVCMHLSWAHSMSYTCSLYLSWAHIVSCTCSLCTHALDVGTRIPALVVLVPGPSTCTSKYESLRKPHEPPGNPFPQTASAVRGSHVIRGSDRLWTAHGRNPEGGRCLPWSPVVSRCLPLLPFSPVVIINHHQSSSSIIITIINHQSSSIIKINQQSSIINHHHHPSSSIIIIINHHPPHQS